METTLGKRIAANRKRLAMTQEQLAEQLGITAQAVSKWENDQSCPDISVLPILADIFQISTDELLGHQTAADCSNVIIDDIHEEESDHNHYRAEANWSIKISSLPMLASASLLLVVGVLFLLAKLFHWDCNFWDILWPSSLFVFGLFGSIGKFSMFWLGCTVLGISFLTYNLVPFPMDLDKSILWVAITLILCGVMMLIGAIRKRHEHEVHIHSDKAAHEYNVNGGHLKCANSFGEQTQLVNAERLQSGAVSNSFGEYTVDLSGVQAITEHCVINASCSFGELVILVPKRFAVIHTSSTTFAGFSIDGEHDEVTEGQIHIKASANFGEIQVKYI